jgi:two-component system, response regulator
MYHEIQILLVEDNPDDAALAIRSLRKNNLINHIVHVSDGEQALDFLFARGEFVTRDSSQQPRVVFLDIKMPKVSGIEVLQQVKAHPLTKSTPVVILTSSAEDPDIRTCYDLGANSYIVKPIDFANFSKTVSELGLYWLMLNKV